MIDLINNQVGCQSKVETIWFSSVASANTSRTEISSFCKCFNQLQHCYTQSVLTRDGPIKTPVFIENLINQYTKPQ